MNIIIITIGEQISSFVVFHVCTFVDRHLLLYYFLNRNSAKTVLICICNNSIRERTKYFMHEDLFTFNPYYESSTY